MSEIQSAYPLILNKVASPHYVTPTLRRERLLDWLHEHANSRALVIAADAGYGKTTLLWQWEREVDFPCYWYKLDRNDRDWSLHVSYLAQAVATRHRDFGKRTHSMLQQVTGPGTSRPGVAAYLLAEMHERLVEPCTFLIDDWQYINAVTEVRGLWNQILRDAPPTCRFVFASRSKPKLQFARLKTHGGYAALDTDALRFTADEVEQLFREIYQSPLEPTELRKLEQRTEGWAASLHLVSVSLRDRSDEQRKQFIESVSASSNTDLFEFLAEEVVDQESPETRNLLLSTSILQQITPELAERMAGAHDGVRELVALEHRGLFTYRLDQGRYRFHNLFREYLERRLVQERTDAEIAGLHIHAASYFETSEQWPEAIHHYLKAGLQRQAARLLARHGEQLVSEGRIDLIGEWLEALPRRTVSENARLSLLLGEFAGFRSDWGVALDALTSARAFFARKGDRRMEALACLKLSTIHHYHGDVDLAADAAREGLQLVDDGDLVTRLRLEGNLAITHGLNSETLESVASTCRRIANESASIGLDHFAAIGYHNVGVVDVYMGRTNDAIRNLSRARDFWQTLPPNPFDEHYSLTMALLAADRVEEADAVTRLSLERTLAWRRSREGATSARALVYIHRGQFREAAATVRPLTADPDALGLQNIQVGWIMAKALFLAGAAPDEIQRVDEALRSGSQDSRQVPPALYQMLVLHSRNGCGGECLNTLEELRQFEQRGHRLYAVEGLAALAALAAEHRHRSGPALLHEAASKAVETGLLRTIRWWTRRATRFARRLATMRGGMELLVGLLHADPEGWRTVVAGLVPSTDRRHRHLLLHALARYPSQEIVDALRGVQDAHVTETRRQIVNRLAPRLYVRTFGGLRAHRSTWKGPLIDIDKRRLRQLMCALAAHSGRVLSRDEAADMLWPDADAVSAANSLNQAVFQLRRLLHPSGSEREGPAYIVTTGDAIQLNPELVVTDLASAKRLLARSNGALPPAPVLGALELIQGPFLPELRYEPWGITVQAAVHAEIRQLLLPIAERSDPRTTPDLSVRAACALAELDPYDEAAHIALARGLSDGGRHIAGRDSLRRFVDKIRDDLDEAPSRNLLAELETLGERV